MERHGSTTTKPGSKDVVLVDLARLPHDAAESVLHNIRHFGIRENSEPLELCRK
ncbi:MAG: hypothetical protein M1504_04355 [Candidatus Marsarchaeota archaeon]|nr:hypothetical protein [Candidatus Marsarchaeota archaeon]